ncbi:MAG TPA: hypothetical protein VFQ26_05570, partial [Nitrospiraceae bacterium]|nr:hypothetical protein [Nitrospiraceae bacterium]
FAAAGGWALIEGLGMFQWVRALLLCVMLDSLVIPIVIGMPLGLLMRFTCGSLAGQENEGDLQSDSPGPN